jgi:hypothetical protein
VAAKSNGLFYVEDNLFIVGSHKLRIIPAIDREGVLNGQNYAAIHFDVSIDGTARPDMIYRAIGFGSGKEAERVAAYGEWYLIFGTPLFQAIAEKGTPITIGHYLAYPGVMGIRGEKHPIGWLDGSSAMNAKVLKRINNALPSTDFISLDIKVAVSPVGKINSESRINGAVSTLLIEQMTGLDWPTSKEGYMFKQAYVLVKRKA